MPLFFVKDDITKMDTDAIVNAANNTLMGGGGVDGAIHRAAGPDLLKECVKLRGCDTGDAKITGGYDLKAKYVIHTVGPIWHGGKYNEENMLRSCYRRSLELATENNLQSISFPMISTGVYGYPFDLALDTAVDEISLFLENNDITVYIVIFPGTELKGDSDVSYLIDRTFNNKNDKVFSAPFESKRVKKNPFRLNRGDAVTELRNEINFEIPDFAPFRPISGSIKGFSGSSLDDYVTDLDEGPKEMLLRLIDNSGIKSGVLCRKSNVTKSVLSKLRNVESYNPSKQMLLAFCIGMELDLKTTQELLSKAGYVLTRSSVFDVVVMYFIEHKLYDINDLNIELFKRDQKLLGSV